MQAVAFTAQKLRRWETLQNTECDIKTIAKGSNELTDRWCQLSASFNRYNGTVQPDFIDCMQYL